VEALHGIPGLHARRGIEDGSTTGSVGGLASVTVGDDPEMRKAIEVLQCVPMLRVQLDLSAYLLGGHRLERHSFEARER